MREAIDPLIAMLGRDDLGRLREDAHRALRSLTGQPHGPYQQPWKDWWADAKAGFTMPPTPADAMTLSAPDKGVTFYGITTFSDRIVFVLDVSGSMLDPARAEGTTGAAARRTGARSTWPARSSTRRWRCSTTRRRSTASSSGTASCACWGR